jgi:hypothetical protein
MGQIQGARIVSQDMQPVKGFIDPDSCFILVQERRSKQFLLDRVNGWSNTF